MKLLTPIFAALIALLCSCNTPDAESNGFVYTIDIDNAREIDTLALSDLYDDVSTIILETGKGSLLSEIRKVVRVGDRIFIYDNGLGIEGSVSEFDMEGSFVRQFGSRGRGPGEYNSIADFAIDEARGQLLILDNRAGRLLSYSLESGKYEEEIQVRGEALIWSAFALIGDKIYAHQTFGEFDMNNPMLISIERSEPSIENHYLPVGEHLNGWTNTSLSNNSDFIYSAGNEYSVFSDKFSNEIFKITPDGIDDYILVKSEYFMGEREREIMSEAWTIGDISAPPTKNPLQTLRELDRYHGVCNFFETDRYIHFWIMRKNSVETFLHDKRSGETRKVKASDLDLFLRSDAVGEFRYLPISFLCADTEGAFYQVRASQVERLRDAAVSGALSADLDKLGEIGRLSEDSNPVIFYLRFK